MIKKQALIDIKNTEKTNEALLKSLDRLKEAYKKSKSESKRKELKQDIDIIKNDFIPFNKNHIKYLKAFVK